jgi:hypothetical protein
MAKKRNVVRAYHRTNPIAMGQRLRAYPLQEWLDEGEELVAIEGEDFTVTRPNFQQDLHNLARRATTVAFANKEEEGWIVRTSTDDLPKTELAFCFLRCPFDECPGFRKPHERKPDRKERLAKARDTYFCENAQPPHVCGDMIGCQVCDPAINPSAPPPSIPNGKAYLAWLQQQAEATLPKPIDPAQIERTPKQEQMLGIPLTQPAQYQNPSAPEPNFTEPAPHTPMIDVHESIYPQPIPLDYTPFNPTPLPPQVQPQPVQLTPEQKAFAEFQQWQQDQAKLNGNGPEA